MKERQEEWQELCKLAAVEQDRDKLLKLTKRIIELLDEREKRLQGQCGNYVARRSNRVFQIAYDEMLLVTRDELLKKRGYEVTSVLGNEAAKRLLHKDQGYRLFIVGRDAPRETREEMVCWLKTNFPKTRILALNSPYETSLTGADYNVPLNGPEAWLAAVATAAT
jgi:hypothetical protein